MSDSNQNWLAVPVRVPDMYIKYAAAARSVIEGEQNHPHGWVLETEELGPVMLKQASTLDTAQGVVGDVAKSVHGAGSEFFPMVGNASRKAQTWMGGPNTLTSMLLHGALAGGLGYGGGWLLNKLFPKAFGKQAPVGMGILGGLAGLGGPLLYHGGPQMKRHGLAGLLQTAPLQGGTTPPPGMEGVSIPDRSTHADVARRAMGGNLQDQTWTYPNKLPPTGRYGKVPDPDFYKRWAQRWGKQGRSSRFADILDDLTAQLSVEVDTEEFEKRALLEGAGGELFDSINTNAWGQVVMRDPFLDNPEKAIAAALPAAAGAMRGSPWVSPRDVANVALNAGLGYGYGYLGSLAAKFLGLQPPIQKGIQRAGLLAGAIRGITGML